MAGGAGHVGSTLAVVLAHAGLQVAIYDTDAAALAALERGRMASTDAAAGALLAEALRAGRLTFVAEPAALSGIAAIVITIDLPEAEALTRCVDGLLPHLDDGAALIVRSTVAPGTTDALAAHVRARGRTLHVAYAPERSVEGEAVAELGTLPQLVGGVDAAATERAAALFRRIAPEIVTLSAREAEYAKLVCNAFRYIQFAATNELAQLVASDGIDYHRLLEKAKAGYPRMAPIPRAGFAAGPCLGPDTERLLARYAGFTLGRAALAINAGMPAAIVAELERQQPLAGRRVGILGMAFKAESDDPRGSLAFVLRDLLQARGAHVTCSDEYVAEAGFVDAQSLLDQTEIVIVTVPHERYAGLRIPAATVVVDTCGALTASPVA